MTRSRKELSYRIDDALRDLHDDHAKEKVKLEAQAVEDKDPVEEVVLGHTQVDPRIVLEAEITKEHDKARDGRNPVPQKVNGSPATFLARLCFIRSAPAYMTEAKEDMSTDQVLARWGGVSCGVSAANSVSVHDLTCNDC